MSDEQKKAQRQQVEAIRRQSSEVENHLIDEYDAGRMSRRDFIRRSTIVGMSLPFIGIIAAACGDDDAGTTTTTAGGGETTTTAGEGEPTTTAGATTTAPPAGEPVTVRVAVPVPTNGVQPVIIQDEGGLSQLGQTGQYLTFSDAELNLIPVLAESWESNDAGDVWTFNLRRGVQYFDGTEMVADDVVATMQNIAAGNASSAFETYGVSADSARAIDDYTVEFTLAAPNAVFPFFGRTTTALSRPFVPLAA